MSITRSDAITAIGTTTLTAILSCLFRPLETEPKRDGDKRLEVVGDDNRDNDEGDINEDSKEGAGNEDDEEFENRA